MLIKQISVFLENHMGALRELTAVLAVGRIDIRELSVADTESFGIVRLIVRADEMDKTMDMLRSAGYTARVNHVFFVEIDDKPGSLSNLLSIIENEKLSVEYMYSCRRAPNGRAQLVLRLSDQEKGKAVLEAYGVCLHSQEEVDNQ